MRRERDHLLCAEITSIFFFSGKEENPTLGRMPEYVLLRSGSSRDRKHPNKDPERRVQASLPARAKAAHIISSSMTAGESLFQNPPTSDRLRTHLPRRSQRL